MKYSTTQLLNLGKVAYENGINAPCLDAELMKIIEDEKLQVGESIPFMDAWSKGWNLAQDNELKSLFPEMYK